MVSLATAAATAATATATAATATAATASPMLMEMLSFLRKSNYFLTFAVEVTNP